MMYKFELQKGTVELLKNNTFANAYSYSAARWEAVAWSTGLSHLGGAADLLTHHLYLSTYFSLEQITSNSVDDAYRRGIYNDIAVTAQQAAIGFDGLWARQTNVIETGGVYDVEFRVRYYDDQSAAFGGGSPGYVELRCGRTGGTLQANGTGTFTATLNQGGDNHIYINMHECLAAVDFVSVKETTAPTFVEVPEPLNLNDIELTIEPDDVLGGVFKKFIGEVTFRSTAYTMIKEVIDEFGSDGYLYCNISTRCNQFLDFEPWFEGIIFMDDYSENVNDCLITVTIESNDLFGKIIRNKDAQFNIFDTYSIGGLFLGVTDRYSVDWNDSGGAAIGNFDSWYVHDILKLAVRWITDDGLNFQADCLGGSDQGYGANGDYSEMIVSTGFELRGYSNREVFVTFSQIWRSIYAAFGVYAKIEDIGGNLTFTVNKYEDNYSSSTSIEFDFVTNIKREIARDIRYKNIRCGFMTYENESQNDGEGFGILNLVFKNDASSGGSKDLLSEIIGSNELILQKTSESNSNLLRFDYDDSLFFGQLTAHGTYETKNIKSEAPYNQGIGFVEANNYLILPWFMYSRHRRYIYDSANLSKFEGNIYGSILVQGHYNDFRSNGTNQFVTWLKLPPGTSDDLYFNYQYEFEKHLKLSEIETIIANQEELIGVSKTDSGHSLGYIMAIKWRLKNQLSSILILSEN